MFVNVYHNGAEGANFGKRKSYSFLVLGSPGVYRAAYTPIDTRPATVLERRIDGASMQLPMNLIPWAR